MKYSYLFIVAAFVSLASANSLPLFESWVDSVQGGQGGEAYYQNSADNSAWSNMSWVAGPPKGWTHTASYEISEYSGGQGNQTWANGYAGQGYIGVAWKPPANTTISGLYNVTATVTCLYCTGGNGDFNFSVYNYSETGTSTKMGTYRFATGLSLRQEISVTMINVTTAGFLRIVMDDNGAGNYDIANVTDLEIRGPAPTVRYMTFRGLDENSPTTEKRISVTVSNSTNSTIYPVTTDNVFFAPIMPGRATVPTGAVTVTIQNTSCQTSGMMPRVFSYTTSTDDVGETAYLVCDGVTPVSETILVTDVAGIPLSSATVLLTRVIGSTQIISRQLTDGTGAVFNYLTSAATYVATVSKFGYNTTVYSFSAQNGAITLMLGLSNASGGFDAIEQYFTWDFSPAVALDYPIFAVNVTVNSTSGNLSYYALNLSLTNGTQLYFSNYTNVTGQIYSSFIDRTGWNDTLLNATLTIGKDGYQPFVVTRIYLLGAWNDTGSLTGLIQGLRAANVSNVMKFTLAIIAAGAFALSGAGTAAGMGLAFVGSLGIISALLGFVDTYILAALALVAAGVYYINRYGGG